MQVNWTKKRQGTVETPVVRSSKPRTSSPPAPTWLLAEIMYIRSAVFLPKSSPNICKKCEAQGKGKHSSPVAFVCVSLRVCVCVCTCNQSCSTLCDPMNCSPPGSSVHGDSSGKNSRAHCHFLLQGDLPDQGSNPSLASLALAGPLPLPLVKPGTSLPVTSSQTLTPPPPITQRPWSSSQRRDKY